MNERHNLRLAVLKNQKRVSENLVKVFNGERRDYEQLIIETLSILYSNRVVGTRFLVEVLGVNGAVIRPYLDVLIKCKAVNCYERGDKDYRQKMWDAYEFQRKYDMVILIKYIKDIEDGKETFDTLKFKKLVKFQTENAAKSSVELAVYRQRAKFIEITEKGKILLTKMLKLYTMLIADKTELGITDDINVLSDKFMKANGIDLDLLMKSSDTLLKQIKEKDIMHLLIKQKSNART